MKTKILIVDDEESICEILSFNLEIEGFEVDCAYSAEQAMKMPLEEYSLIILDVMMSGKSGFKMAKEMKESPLTADIPIIFCSAMGSEESKVTGLTIGADDYIAKPFSVREVVARVKSVLRRCHKEGDSQILEFKGLRVDILKHKCYIDSSEVALTKTELEILILMLKNPGRVFSREEILKRIWKDEVIVLDRTIDVNITRLRKKLGEYGNYLTTSQGYGYGFNI